MFTLILKGAFLGLGATILMDIWHIVLSRLPGQKRADWAPVGRWAWHLRGGAVFHDDIAVVAPYQNELALGWSVHYAVGVLYGVIFALIVGDDWFAAPSLLPAWIFGIVTVAAGWFLLQPGLGLGWAASRAPNPTKVRALNLVAHTIFAIGLYGTALLIR
jgi:hypothetical protein